MEGNCLKMSNFGLNENKLPKEFYPPEYVNEKKKN